MIKMLNEKGDNFILVAFFLRIESFYLPFMNSFARNGWFAVFDPRKIRDML